MLSWLAVSTLSGMLPCDQTCLVQEKCSKKCEEDANCDHFAVGSTCYIYAGCTLVSGSNTGLTYYKKVFEAPSDNPRDNVGFNGIILQLNDDNSGFIEPSECEDYGYVDVAINRYDPSRTMCEPTTLNYPTVSNYAAGPATIRSNRCYHGVGTVLCSAGGSFSSWDDMRSGLGAPSPTAKCIACPKGYIATRFFGGDPENEDDYPAFAVNLNLFEDTDHGPGVAPCPNTKNKLECRPMWGDWFKAWGDNPLKSGEVTAANVVNLALGSTFQCAPWGAESVAAPNRHCLTAGTKFTRYNAVGGDGNTGDDFW